MRKSPADERFWAKVEVDGDCWRWLGRPNMSGYGELRVNGRGQKAHRFAYELLVGPIPDGLTIDHLCRNRWCVNPGHLEPVTRLENVRRGMAWSFHRSKTHCPRDHEYSEQNTRWYGNRRHCRACDRESQRRYAARVKILSDGVQ